jgi:hypothetical protein
MRNELIRKQHENTGREELIKDYEAAHDEYSGMT